MSLTPRPAVPMVADEVTLLRTTLDRYRVTLRRQVEDLSDAELHAPFPVGTMTLGGLLKHLAFVEHWWLPVVMTGQAMAPPWSGVDWRVEEDWDWRSAASDDAATLLAVFDAAVAESERLVDEILSVDGLDRIAVRAPGDRERPSLRWILLHLVGEYARHAGHADLLRERIDGVTGR